MGIITQAISLIPGLRSSVEGPLPLTSARLLEWLGGQPTITGVRISEDTALRLSAVWACVRVITEDVGSLPLMLYRRLERGKERAIYHPLYRLIHDAPNPYMTAMQFKETLQGHLLLWGNAYAEIQRDSSGQPVALWPLRPDRMDQPVESQAGTLLYTYRLPKTGESVVLRQSQVLHLRGLSSNGVTGYSPIALHRDTLGSAQAALEYGARLYANDSRPGGVLQTDTRLTDEAAKRLRDSWEESHRGLTNTHRVAILEQGLKWQQIGMAPEDAQYIETRKFSRTEIAAIYRVPPHKIGDLERATFSNIEEQSIDYVTYTLRAWLIRWEQQINKDVILPSEQSSFYSEHLMEALLRAKYLERQQGLQIQRQNGIISADDWNELENRNPLPEGKGEDFWMPANMTPVGTLPLKGAASTSGAVVSD